MHQAAVLSITTCLYVIGDVRNIFYTGLFEFEQEEIHRYNSNLELEFTRMKWIYDMGTVEPNISIDLRDVGFSIERDNLIQRIQL